MVFVKYLFFFYCNFYPSNRKKIISYFSFSIITVRHISTDLVHRLNLFELLDCLQVVAEKHVQKDAPLELNYGCMNNDIFLLDYGFVIAANPYDSIEFQYDPELLEASSLSIGLNSPYFSSPASWQSEILSALKLDNKMAPSKVCSFPVFLIGFDAYSMPDFNLL